MNDTLLESLDDGAFAAWRWVVSGWDASALVRRRLESCIAVGPQVLAVDDEGEAIRRTIELRALLKSTSHDDLAVAGAGDLDAAENPSNSTAEETADLVPVDTDPVDDGPVDDPLDLGAIVVNWVTDDGESVERYVMQQRESGWWICDPDVGALAVDDSRLIDHIADLLPS